MNPTALSRRALLKSTASGFGYLAFAGMSSMAAAGSKDSPCLAQALLSAFAPRRTRSFAERRPTLKEDPFLRGAKADKGSSTRERQSRRDGIGARSTPGGDRRRVSKSRSDGGQYP